MVQAVLNLTMWQSSLCGGDRLLTVADQVSQTHLLGAEALAGDACSRLTRNLTLIEWLRYLGREPLRRTCEDLPDPWTPESKEPEP